MVVEKPQAADKPLPSSHERRKVRRAQETVPEDVKQDLDVALRELDVPLGLALEAALALGDGLGLGEHGGNGSIRCRIFWLV